MTASKCQAWPRASFWKPRGRLSGLLGFASLTSISGCAALAGLNEDFCVVDPDTGMCSTTSAPDDSTPPPTGGSGGSGAGGSPQAPDLTLPDGHLAFTRTTGDVSQLYLANLSNGVLSEDLGKLYGLCHPKSPAFDPTGQYLAVSAIEASTNDCSIHDNDKREIFVIDLEPSGTAKKITSNGVEESDPTFDGTPGLGPSRYLYFLSEGRLVRWATENMESIAPFSACHATTPGSECFAESQTVMKPTIVAQTADASEHVCYQVGSLGEANIYCVDLSAPDVLTTPLEAQHEALSGDYPKSAPWAAKGVIYFQADDQEGPQTVARTFTMDLNEEPEIAGFQFISDDDLSLPSLLENELIVFSQAGDLQVGDFQQARFWNLDSFFDDSSINTDGDESFAVFSPAQ